MVGVAFATTLIALTRARELCLRMFEKWLTEIAKTDNY
jgi:hypothetical protein